MIPYYLLLSKDFNPNKIKSFSSNSQKGLEKLANDTPLSSFQLNLSLQIQGYTTYDLKTEVLKRQKGRAYGNPDIFQDFILIKEDYMFYNKTHNLLILSTSKDNFYYFKKRCKGNNVFTCSSIDINFSTIIDNVQNLGTDGIWLGELGNTNINAVGLMGHRVQDSTEYQQYIDTGAKITNMSFIYDFNGKQEKVMISKEGGVILYQTKKIEDALDLVIDVYEKMLLN